MFARSSLADPLALRAPVPGSGATAVIGTPWLGLGVRPTSTLGLALEGRTNSALGLSAGARFAVAGHAYGLGVEAHGALGLLYLRYAASTALTATVALQLRYRAPQWVAAVGAALPLEVQLSGESILRMPVLGELWFALDAGGFWAGAQVSLGAAIIPGYATEPVAQASLFVTVPFATLGSGAPASRATPAQPTRPPTTGPW